MNFFIPFFFEILKDRQCSIHRMAVFRGNCCRFWACTFSDDNFMGEGVEGPEAVAGEGFAVEDDDAEGDFWGMFFHFIHFSQNSG